MLRRLGKQIETVIAPVDHWRVEFYGWNALILLHAAMAQQGRSIVAERRKSACKKVEGKHGCNPQNIERDPDAIFDKPGRRLAVTLARTGTALSTQLSVFTLPVTSWDRR